jgi:hypothetical protein
LLPLNSHAKLLSLEVNMSGLASLNDVPFLLIYAGVVAVLTIGVCLTLGRWLARRSKALALFICGLLMPILGFAAGFIVIATAPSGPPPNDAPAMLAFAIYALAAFSLPVSVVTSLVVFSTIKRPFS